MREVEKINILNNKISIHYFFLLTIIKNIFFFCYYLFFLTRSSQFSKYAMIFIN